jgi:saccharopine dehydrogenase-like NADP-dependent oxidoreductase
MVTHLLASSGDYEVRVADSRPAAAEEAIAGLSAVTALGLSFEDAKALDDAMSGAQAVISCAPFTANPLIAERARAGELHYLDLTEDVAVTRRVGALAEGASRAFIPQCGLAPGFITIVANHLIGPMSEVHDLRMRVGALPRFPSNQLKYNLTWSTEGLINEYIHDCDALVDGELARVPALEHLERITVDGVQYEAFNTSGGVGSLAATLRGRARNVGYKTIRYPGHNALIKFLMEDLRMREHPGELRKIFERALPATAQDQVVVFVNATGMVGGEFMERSYANTLFHSEIHGQPWSAIQITTAAGVCAVLDLLMTEQLPQSGFVRQEEVDYTAFLANRFGQYYA